MKLKATLTAVLAACSCLVFSQTTNYLMDGALTNLSTCSGFFMDSGGSANPYGPNQHFTTTICPGSTGGTHIQLVFSGTQIATGDELCFFDGPNTSATSLGCASDYNYNSAFIIQATAANPSGCITVTFDSDGSNEGSGWGADINCIAACQTILAVLDSSTPAAVPSDTGWIDICPGDRVFFNGKGLYPQNGVAYQHSDLTSSFEWNFGDGTTTLGPNVSKVYNNSGGYVVQLTIKDQMGCKNTNFLSQRIRVAPRPDFDLSTYQSKICAGDTLHLNAMVNDKDSLHTVSVTSGNASFQTQGVRSDSLPLPDGNGASYSTSISFNNFAPGQLLTDINDILGIWVNMEHSWMRDLQIEIACPNGSSLLLHNHAGHIGGEVFLGVPYEADEGFPVPIPGLGWDYGWSPNPDYNYTWINYANTFSPHTLPAGTYMAAEDWSKLLGCPLNGEWTIKVTDLWAIDNGYIFSWAIEFDPDLYPLVETFSPDLVNWGWNNHPSIYNLTTDSLDASPFNAGQVTYTFTVQDTFGCNWDTTVSIQVLPFTHPDCHNCEEIINPADDVSVCEGDSVSFDVSTPLQADSPVTFESYDNYPIGASNHPPAKPYNSTITVNSIYPATITNVFNDVVSVCVDLSTDFDADIQMFLRTPDNKLLELTTNNGGSGDNYTQTCFTTAAMVPITAGAPPFTGDFLPEGSWNILNGSPVNGNWTLRVSDAFGVNAMGKLNWWNITFNTKNNVTYTWTPTNGLSCNNCPDPTASPATSTAFQVTAQDNFGCITRDTINFTVLNNLVAPTVQCQFQTAGTVIVNWNDIAPGLSYEININNTGWTDPNNGPLSHLVFGLINGDSVNAQVRAKITGAACDVETGAALYIYQFCPMVAYLATPGPFAVSCNGLCDAQLDITIDQASAPFTFNITNQTTGSQYSQASSTLLDLCAGSYTVIVLEDLTGCLDTVNFIVADQPAILVNAAQVSPVSCNGGSDGCAMATASGGTGGFTFTWSNPNMSTGQSICTLAAGLYTVTATDSNGCNATTTVNMSQAPPIDLAISKTDVKCKGGNSGTATAIASGGTGPYTYQWSGGTAVNEQTTQGLTAGTYSLTVTDSKGCQAFGNITIGEPTSGVSVTAQQSVISCFGEDQSQATATPAGGSGNYTYLWTPTGQTGQTAANLAPGSYSVVITDMSGCTASASVALVQWEPINISVSFSPPTCNGLADGEMAANIVTGGNGVYSYSWNNGQTSDYIDGLTGGQAYSITVTDSQGCTGTASRFLEDPPSIEIKFSTSDALCFGSADGSATVTNVLYANFPVTYQWDPLALNQTTATADSLKAGTYAVVVIDSNGCTGSGAVTINEPPAIKTTFEITNNKCFGDEQGEVKVTASGGAGGYSFQWSNGQTSAILTNLAADKYYLTITDINGCVQLDSAFVSAPDWVDATLEIKDVSCFGSRDGGITILPEGGTPPFTYSLDGNNFYGNSTLIALKAGDYKVHLKDAKGCIAILDATVYEPPKISVAILANGESEDEIIIHYGEDISLVADITNSQGLPSITWTAAWCGTLFEDSISDCDDTLTAESLLASPDYSNDYFVVVVDEKGCKAEDHLQVHVKKQRRVQVPTGFTPNNDGSNDLLSVHGKAGTIIRVFKIFDRWGELLFQDTDLPINDTSRGWDGTFRSKDMPPGVYVWYIEAEYEDGMKDSFKGETTLIR